MRRLQLLVRHILIRQHGSDSGLAPEGFTERSMFDNGWVSTPSSQLLFWVPPCYRLGLFRPSNTAVMAAEAVRLDFTQFLHGSDWERCMIPWLDAGKEM